MVLLTCLTGWVAQGRPREAVGPAAQNVRRTTDTLLTGPGVEFRELEGRWAWSVFEIVLAVFGLVGDPVASFLGWLGWGRFALRDEAKPDRRNFKPPH